MNRQIISASRLVAYHQIKRNWLKHQDRLIHIKGTINSRRLPSHLPTPRKTNYSKSLEIELENKALLKKLTDRVDHRNDISMCTSFSLPKSNRKKYYQEYKIRCENEGLYRRLRETKPIIDTTKMQTERRNTERYLNTISKFGYKKLKPNKTFLKFQMKNNELKYLSKRRILLSSKQQQNENEKEASRISAEKERQKAERNQRIVDYFSRPRQIIIDQQPVLLSIAIVQEDIVLELKGANEKQNNQSLQLEVKIDKKLFISKFKGDLQYLVHKLRYNSQQHLFYIK